MVTQHYRFSPLSGLRLEMDRLFDRLFAGSPGALPAWQRTYPAMNVWEENDGFVIEAELPGIQMKDLDISVQGEELTVRGQMGTKGPEGAAWHRRERTTGEFERIITLPTPVKEEGVEATLKDGVLAIRLPKRDEVRPRKVDVKLLK